MQFDKNSGDFVLSGISFHRLQPYNEVYKNFMERNYDLKLFVNNYPYQTYGVLAMKDGEQVFNMSISFNSNQLILISVSLDTDDKNLEEFINKSLEECKKKTFALVKTLLGSDKCSGEWGTAGYSFDQKSMTVGFSINYHIKG